MKSKVKSITITRGEGSPHLVGKPFTFTSFWQADNHLSRYAHTYPKVGYDKHDVRIEWDNGVVYEMRIDAVHPENEFYYYGCNSLEHCFLDSCRYWAVPTFDQLHPALLKITVRHSSNSLP